MYWVGMGVFAQYSNIDISNFEFRILKYILWKNEYKETP